MSIIFQISLLMARDQLHEEVPESYCDGLTVTKQQAYDDANL